MANGTSLLEQNDALKKKWGGDIYNYDINSVIKGYDSNLAKYNDKATTQAEKDSINALYGGDITTWDNKNAYTNYMNDYNFARSVDALNSAYTSALDNAKQNESRAIQYADTRRQLMEKYLPETLLAQGVANTGYTADALLKAENNYNQYVMGAMSDRAAAEQDAMQAYQNALRDYKTQKATNEYQIFLDQQAKAEQDALNQETKDANTKAYMSGFISDIDAGADINSVIKQAQIAGLSEEDIADLRKYDNESTERAQTELYNTLKNSAGQWTKEQLAENKQYLTDEQYNSLLNEYYRPANTSTKVGASATNYGGKTGKGRDLISPAVEDDGFTIDINGDKYALKTGKNEPHDSEVFNYAFHHKDEIADGQVFMYDGKLYVKNGTAIQAIQSPGSSNYKQVIKYLSESN
jgi:hypothetical protein